MKLFRAIPEVLIISALALPFRAGADSIVNSPHNLSSGSTARVTSTEETRVCIFCHTPHHATKLSDTSYTGPLWSREENTAQDYTPYVSTTIAASPGQPQGPSRLCLSCHDGTIALGAPGTHATSAALGPLTPPPTGKSTVLGKDLRDDHPISMEYGRKTSEFRDAAAVTGTTRIKLVRRASTLYVECTSCHDPHDNQYGNFLVLDTSSHRDALCTVCHVKADWTGSAHENGGTRSSGSIPTDVAKSGCVNCHTPHGAQQGVDLLTLTATGASMDTNCYVSCHNSASYPSNIYSQFNVSGAHHPSGGYDGAANKHSETETLPLPATDKHVHCVDCHNPHQAIWQNAPLSNATPSPNGPPSVNGVLKGVRGIDINGSQKTAASYEYEICFRCHSGDAALAGNYNAYPQVSRTFSSLDERERFDWGSAKSWHPVAKEFVRVGNSQGLSLKSASMTMIYCNDCHDSHGSGTHLLRLENPDTFSQGQSISNYPLCYSCHDETYLTSSATNIGKLHRAHVWGQHNPLSTNNSYRASCSACHDPHGVPYKAGLTTSSNSLHLINFDLRYAGAGSSYDASTSSCLVTGTGTSGLSCHPTTTGTASFNPYPYP